MATEIRLPQWGMGMQEGTVVRWLKREGDPVEEGEDLVEIEAAKTSQAVTAPAAGILLRVLVPEGETVPVRTPLAVVGAPEETTAGQIAPQPALAPVATQATAQPNGTAAGRPVQVTPVARRLAKDLGVDLSQVIGSGPHGRIDEADVRAFLERQQAATPSPSVSVVPAPVSTGADQPTADRLEPASSMRRAIARHMLASLQSMAQLTLFTERDATELVRLRERLQRDFALTYTDLVVRAVALALRQHPRLNASLEGDQVCVHAGIHVGVAVALEDGLIVPVIRDADRKSLREIATEMKTLAERARAGQLRPEEVTGSTFSITNLGTHGVDGFTPIVNPPEAAILGVGRIMEKPAAYRGTIALRHLLTLSLTHDHRLIDGAPAAAFLQTLGEMIETPYFLGPG